MNFLEELEAARLGRNKGLSTGLRNLNRAIDGIQKKTIYGIAASPKVGKTTLSDYCFILAPYLFKKEEEDIQWIYFSFEIDRIKKELKFACFFLMFDYQIDHFYHNGVRIPISPRYLSGRLKDESGNLIPILPDHYEKLMEIYQKRIIPLFGEYDRNGRKIKDGLITFIEERTNPTGLRNLLIDYAKKEGEFVRETYVVNEGGSPVEKSRITGYKPNNPDKYTIIITDHIRKLLPERGFTKKDTIDKWSEYCVELRNWCKWTFVQICHLNRELGSIDRIKFNPEFLFPTGDQVKDSGNLSEDVDVMITMFNANDDKYGIKKHFGLRLVDDSNNLLYPNYRSLHIVESRDTECPLHLQINMYGNINYFMPIQNDNINN